MVKYFSLVSQEANFRGWALNDSPFLSICYDILWRITRSNFLLVLFSVFTWEETGAALQRWGGLFFFQGTHQESRLGMGLLPKSRMLLINNWPSFWSQASRDIFLQPRFLRLMPLLPYNPAWIVWSAPLGAWGWPIAWGETSCPLGKCVEDTCSHTQAHTGLTLKSIRLSFWARICDCSVKVFF